MRILLTGATGKVGQNFLPQFLADTRFANWDVIAICNNRTLAPHPRVTCVRGSMADAEVVARAMADITHVVHMAAVKETPDQVVDVALKGMFLLLEEARRSRTFKQFILIGGDCSVGHIFHDYPEPITENSVRRAYPGCYALTKVIEEVMLEQFQIQYGINGCCLRNPWIMEKDDFRFAMSFGPDQFGGPPWHELLSPQEIFRAEQEGTIPLLLDQLGKPLLRNFIHVHDVVQAILAVIDVPACREQLFNVAMNNPIDYADIVEIGAAEFSLTPFEVKTPYFGNWISNAKLRKAVDWQPDYNLRRMMIEAWSYVRSPNDLRKTWYPG